MRNSVFGYSQAIATLVLSIILMGCGSETGLIAHKYEGNWNQLPDFASLTPTEQRTIYYVGTHGMGSTNYGLVIKGLINIEQAGNYRFALRSDDGSSLSINNQLIINNDGVHEASTVTSSPVSLAAGDHELRIEYFQVSDSQLLELSYQLNNQPMVQVPSDAFSHTSAHKSADTVGNSGGGGDPEVSNSIDRNSDLLLGEYLESTNGDYRFYLQSDGNLVLRDTATSSSLWSSGTHGDGGARLDVQGDGNLVLYTANGDPVWATSTVGSGANLLRLNNDGSLVLYNGSTPVWSVNSATGTGDGVKIAFIGDTGAGSNFQRVLNLIKSEGAELTIVAGDTSYDRNKDDDWDAMVRNTLGSQDPALIAAGNHDYGDSEFDAVRSFGINRLNRATNIDCDGEYAEQMTCNYKNIYFVLSAIGSGGSRSDHENYIENRLNNSPTGAWRVCAWHKNQRDMQVGGKSDEVGWGAYETCRRNGAIIATGHEHSYSRTHLLSDMSDQIIASTSSTLTVTEGRTFAFVSGLGGISIRDQERGGDWWASIYTSNQGARYGAMFGTFYEDRAEFYFKNINGQIIDQFTVNKGY